jgi:hypothetical protein
VEKCDAHCDDSRSLLNHLHAQGLSPVFVIVRVTVFSSPTLDESTASAMAQSEWLKSAPHVTKSNHTRFDTQTRTSPHPSSFLLYEPHTTLIPIILASAYAADFSDLLRQTIDCCSPLRGVDDGDLESRGLSAHFIGDFYPLALSSNSAPTGR